jgi:hypothetical protein
VVRDDDLNCDHKYPRGSEWCAICGRYRHADYVKEVVAKAPPLSEDQINRISLIFAGAAKEIDWKAVAAEGVMAGVIQQHGLVRYPVECACGENFRRPQDWGRHVVKAIYDTLKAAGVTGRRPGRHAGG